MLKSPIPCEKPAMTKTEAKPVAESVNALFSNSPDGLREIVRAVMQEMLETEMTDALGAEKGERSAARLGYRSGYYSRTLVTRVGKLELRVPQDRDGRFSTELFERYQRSEQALVATLAEMYVQGVSTRKVKAITEVRATPFRPRPSPPSTSVWTKASRPLPDAPSRSPLPISSSMRAMRRCGKAAW
jgi:transposase-like protein